MIKTRCSHCNHSIHNGRNVTHIGDDVFHTICYHAAQAEVHGRPTYSQELRSMAAAVLQGQAVSQDAFRAMQPDWQSWSAEMQSIIGDQTFTKLNRELDLTRSAYIVLLGAWIPYKDQPE